MCDVAAGGRASLLTSENMCKAAKAVRGTKRQIKSQLDCFNLLYPIQELGSCYKGFQYSITKQKCSHTAILVVAAKLTKMLSKAISLRSLHSMCTL